MTPFREPIHRPARLGDGPDRAVVIHGFAGSPADTRPMGESLAGRGWRVHLPLLPGFGHEYDTLAGTTWRDWRAAVAAELRAAGREARRRGGRLVAIGFSMGGALVLSSLTDEGVDVDGVVLVAPFTRFVDRRALFLPLARFVVKHLRPYAAADFSCPDVRDHVLRKVGSVDLDDPEVQRNLRRQVTVPVRALDELRRAGRHALRAACTVEGLPVLVIQGGRDTTVAPATTRSLVERFPTPPETVWLPQADHRLVLPGRPGHDEMLTAIAHFAATLRGDFGSRGLAERWSANARRSP